MFRDKDARYLDFTGARRCTRAARGLKSGIAFHQEAQGFPLDRERGRWIIRGNRGRNSIVNHWRPMDPAERIAACKSILFPLCNRQKLDIARASP